MFYEKKRSGTLLSHVSVFLALFVLEFEQNEKAAL
jgi:hypothetical protein